MKGRTLEKGKAGILWRREREEERGTPEKGEGGRGERGGRREKARGGEKREKARGERVDWREKEGEEVKHSRKVSCMHP